MISVTQFILLLILFAGLFYVLLKKEPNIWSPPIIFLAMWAFIILFSVISGDGYYFSFNPLIFLFSQIAAFTVGWIFLKPSAPAVKNVSTENFPVSIMHAALLAGIIAGWISIVLLFSENFHGVFDKNSLSLFSATLSRERYEGVRLSASIMLAISINYLGCFTAGVVNVFSKSKIKKVISISVLLPLIIFSVVYTSRSVLLYGLVMFMASWLLAQAFLSGNKKPQIKVKWILFGLSGVVVLFLLFMISQGLRMGINQVSISTFDRLFSYLRVWFAGNISSFCMWYDQPDVSPLYSHGSFTLAGISEIAGFGRRVPGLYTVSYDISGKLEVTNIYTLFRFVVDDLGWTGASIFWLLLGICSSALYNAILKGSIISFAVLSGILAGLLFSFIASVWAYNSILFAWIGFISICSIPLIKREFIS